MKNLFEFKEDEVLAIDQILAAMKTDELNFHDHGESEALPKSKSMDFFRPEKKPEIKNLQDQFITFQLSNATNGPTLLESSEVEPSIPGTYDEPDIIMSMEMQSFHLAKNLPVDQQSKATMRINIGKDENSTDNQFSTAFWSIAAGLDLYNNYKEEASSPKDFKANFKQAFGNRPIEIPGGLTKMTFEVVKHREPSWWNRIFDFLKTDTGKTLISTLGFPANTNQAIQMIDELLNRLDDNEPEVLFKSKPLRLALSEKAKTDYSGGNPRIKVGSLSPGFCILAKGKDYTTFLNNDAFYYPAYQGNRI